MATPSKAKLLRCTRDDTSLENKEKNDLNDETKYVNNDVELTFDVLTIIFKYLKARDLLRAAVVCRTWNDAAENEKRIRGASSVVFFEDGKEMRANEKETVNDLWIKPMFSIMFISNFNHSIMKKAADCACRALPDRCMHIVVGNSGVIKDRTELEDNTEKAAWVLLPYDKDVIIETVCVPTKFTILNTEPSHHIRVKQIFKRLLAAKRKVKCFILLTNEIIASPYMMLDLLPPDKQRAVAGSAVRELTRCKRTGHDAMCSESMACIGIAISGRNVRSWSVVLKKDCNTQQKVVDKLKAFKEQVKLRKHAVGFMFACEGRGEYMFHDQNVESSAFKEQFPTVPLVGSFGGGEYGDSTGGDRINGRVHQYSTVFTIVTYGPS